MATPYYCNNQIGNAIVEKFLKNSCEGGRLASLVFSIYYERQISGGFYAGSTVPLADILQLYLDNFIRSQDVTMFEPPWRVLRAEDKPTAKTAWEIKGTLVQQDG